MSAGLLIFVGCIYLAVAEAYRREGRVGMAVAFVAYAAANLGLALDGRGK